MHKSKLNLSPGLWGTPKTRFLKHAIWSSIKYLTFRKCKWLSKTYLNLILGIMVQKILTSDNLCNLVKTVKVTKM